MAKEIIFIDAEAEAYSVEQVRQTMTVEDLMCYLEQFAPDTPIYIRNDGGYTYGAVQVCDELVDDE